MNSIAFSLDLELDEDEELSAGYENDPELSDIIRRLTSTRQDTLHEQYLWSELRQDPLDLCLWSFLTFLHHGIDKVEKHLL